MSSLRYALQLLTWACLSVSVSMSNKWIMWRLGFNFPILLSFMHLTGAALTLNAYTAFKRRMLVGNMQRPSLQSTSPVLHKHGKDVIASLTLSKDESIEHTSIACLHDNASWAQYEAWWLKNYGRHIVAIAAMFGASVCLKNSAFAGLPVSVMQLIASSAPLCTYAVCVATRLAEPTIGSFACLSACIGGVAIAVSDSSMPVNKLALARHACGTLIDVCRIVLFQVLIQKINAADPPSTRMGRMTAPSQIAWRWQSNLGTYASRAQAITLQQKMQHAVEEPAKADVQHKAAVPLSTAVLAVYSPICAAALIFPVIIFEWHRAVQDVTTRPLWFWAAIAGNVMAALGLNLAAVSCLHKVGAMTLSMTGFAKDWVLIALSGLVFGRELTPRFVGGLLITTIGSATFATQKKSG